MEELNVLARKVMVELEEMETTCTVTQVQPQKLPEEKSLELKKTFTRRASTRQLKNKLKAVKQQMAALEEFALLNFPSYASPIIFQHLMLHELEKAIEGDKNLTAVDRNDKLSN